MSDLISTPSKNIPTSIMGWLTPQTLLAKLTPLPQAP